MQRIAPTGKAAASHALEKRLWDAADPFQANSGLKAQEYSAPVLGLVFMRFVKVQIHNFRRTCDLLLPRLLSG